MRNPDRNTTMRHGKDGAFTSQWAFRSTAVRMVWGALLTHETREEAMGDLLYGCRLPGVIAVKYTGPDMTFILRKKEGY